MRKLRVIHLPASIGGNAQNLSRYMAALGIESETWVLDGNRFGYAADRRLFSDGDNVFLRELKRLGAMVRLLGADVIFYNFGSTLFGGVGLGEPIGQGKRLEALHRWYLMSMQRLELWLLRKTGCVCLVQYQGDDARQGDFSRGQFPVSIAAHVEPGYYSTVGDEHKRAQIRLMGKYCHKVYALNPDLLHVLPQTAVFLPYAHISLEDWQTAYGSETDDTPLRIGHAPTHRGVKGTDKLLEALETLRAEGLAFELVLVEGKTQIEAKHLYATTDVVFDQLYAGWYGGLAVEAMALGKPVMVYLREDDLGFIPAEMRAELPFIRTAPDSLLDDLRTLLRTPRRRLIEAGKRGRAYVEKWHDPALIARRVVADIHEVYGLRLSGTELR